MHNVILQNQMDALGSTKNVGLNFKDAYIRANIKGEFVRTDFRGVRLQDMKIRDAVFAECDFSGAVITADITNVQFIQCNFEGATFKHVYVYDSAFMDNCFKQSQFLYAAFHQTELSDNDFEKANMYGADMKDIIVNRPNRNSSTIQYEYPRLSKDDLEQMKANCLNKLAGVEKLSEKQQQADTRPEFVRNSKYDAAYQQAIYAGINRALDFQINHGFEDMRGELQYLVDRYRHEEGISDKYLIEKLEEYNRIAEQKYGTNEVKKTENRWEAAVEEVLASAPIAESDLEMEM